MPLPVVTSRKFGVEMEGYLDTPPNRIRLSNGATIKRDGSLRNSHWDNTVSLPGDARDYGVEIVTRPIHNLSVIDSLFSEMQRHNWHVDNRAGTHVHIDISDYSEFDKAKLLRFAKGIERIIFMFVKDYRSGNNYCRNLHDQWRRIFRPISKVHSYRSNGRLRRSTREETLNLERLTGRERNLLTVLHNAGLTQCENSKYYWLNIYGSGHGTAEFRIFHAVDNALETKSFVLIAHSIVELCKNCSVPQLEFILLSLYESQDASAMKRNFLNLLNLEDANVLIKGTAAKEYLNTKLRENHSKRIAESSLMA